MPETRPTITPGVYRHFKGNIYHVIGVAQNTETKEFLVLYAPQYGEYKGMKSVRPLEMFTETVDKPEYDYKGPRFTLLEERSPSDFDFGTGSFR